MLSDAESELFKAIELLKYLKLWLRLGVFTE